ncbi:MAG: CDP-glucose 4,6-dehydratase [Synergistaceae bacterium]|jgi:CDP-glucose 4,6-dehydratase|nr:CDP-glucose 4,6-dehydratase [Synergistaceae bacterium]
MRKKKLRDFWNGKKVFLTGHTGFKGCWLMLWLEMLGAEVYGYSLEPSEPSLFRSAIPPDEKRGVYADIRDARKVADEIYSFSPEIVFHLAAQPLVRESYKDPVLTYQTNVMGTVSVLEAIRAAKTVRAAVIVTTDKCYRNMEWEWGYRETDALGGEDPYSSSKSCAELICEAYRTSFFKDSDTRLATARAGNVIGGGDWAEDRLIPDAIRAFEGGRTLAVRSPDAVRPWQYVLEPLRGYMMLAEHLRGEGGDYAAAWNFGPSPEDARNVGHVVNRLAELWGNGAKYEADRDDAFHESLFLRLDSSRAIQKLGWRQMLNFSEAISLTVKWYRDVSLGADAADTTKGQISLYMDRLDTDIKN